MNISVRKATPEDVESIKRVSDRYSAEIGFVVRGALVDAVSRGGLLIEATSYSFCHYRVRKDGVSVIYEICVPLGYRRMGIAKELLRQVPRPVRLKCPVDNRSNAFYAHMGFTLLETVAGKKRKLNVWGLE